MILDKTKTLQCGVQLHDGRVLYFDTQAEEDAFIVNLQIATKSPEDWRDCWRHYRLLNEVANAQ